MRTVKEIKANIDKLIDENWLWFDPNPEGEGDIVRITPDNIPEAADLYKVPEKFLVMVDDALRTMANDIIIELHKDLEDIWKRLED